MAVTRLANKADKTFTRSGLEFIHRHSLAKPYVKADLIALAPNSTNTLSRPRRH